MAEPDPPQRALDAKIGRRLARLYGKERGSTVAAELLRRLDAVGATLATRAPKSARRRPPFSAADSVLITYGDSLRRPGVAPLAVLHELATTRLRDAFSTIHLLPFFPYSSDDGFSVTDFAAVDPALGSWEDVQALGAAGFRLAFDFVLNHVSSQSEWFQRYLAGDEAFADLALAIDPRTDLSAVTRPRALPLLSPYQRADGSTVHIWTTFSADQIDLDYRNPAVLLRMINLLCDYVARGATILRLDAVGFLWKRVGTSCIHLPQTHEVVRLLRDVLDRVAPDVLLLSETNVPHAENIAYFGDGANEAQLVYNFTLPPLLLHALSIGDTRALTRWANTLATPSEETTFFNFTASHDGIGLRPLEGIIDNDAIAALGDLARARGGRVSSRRRPDGGASPYELNVTYVDATAGRESGGDEHVRRFLATQAIALALPGVPAVYIGSLLGSRNWSTGVEQSGQPRAINRQKLDLDRVTAELDRAGSFRARVFSALTRLLELRRRQPAFCPSADAELFDLRASSSPARAGIFAVARRCAEQHLLALTNLRAEHIDLALPEPFSSASICDLLAPGQAPVMSGRVTLAPYQTRWLQRPRKAPALAVHEKHLPSHFSS